MVNVLRFYDLERVLPLISMSDEFLNVTFNEAELGLELNCDEYSLWNGTDANDDVEVWLKLHFQSGTVYGCKHYLWI